MLTGLKIGNFALIRELDISFAQNLSTITGETGTGKSIMLGALGLVLGNRADTAALLDTSRKCVVEAYFDIQNYNLQPLFDRLELDYEDETIIRREISPNGKSRAFVNDVPVTLPVLKELGQHLINIHSQHQTIELREKGYQLNLLDAFAKHDQVLTDYRSQYKRYRSILRELETKREQNRLALKDFDYLQFQLEELQAADPQTGELEALEEELNVLSNAEDIGRTLQEANYLIDESERGILNQGAEIRRSLSSIASLNPTLRNLAERVESQLVEWKELAREISSYADTVVVDNERMQKVNERLALLNRLLHKHQLRELGELITLREEIEKKVSSVAFLGEDITHLEKELAAQEKALRKLADTLTDNRIKAVKPLEENLVGLLHQLGIPEAQVKVQLDKWESYTDTGLDKIDILFSANRGAKPGPIAQVASGGELSRIMLSFKYILADSLFLPTIIFDEIDTGVSGEVAIQVGKMIKKLAERHQVMCITHQPQVAAMGKHHYVVFKQPSEDITETRIRQLSDKERVDEIAKMIGGHRPSALAIDSARELLHQYAGQGQFQGKFL